MIKGNSQAQTKTAHWPVRQTIDRYSNQYKSARTLRYAGQLQKLVRILNTRNITWSLGDINPRVSRLHNSDLGMPGSIRRSLLRVMMSGSSSVAKSAP